MNKYEERMKELFNELIEVYKEYNPEGDYLSLAYVVNDYGELYEISNAHWEDSVPVSFHWWGDK